MEVFVTSSKLSTHSLNVTSLILFVSKDDNTLLKFSFFLTLWNRLLISSLTFGTSFFNEPITVENPERKPPSFALLLS